MTPSILVLERQLAIQSLLVGNLNQAGFVAVGAGCAEEGLSLIRTIRPDLVVLDCTLPDRSGNPLLNSLRDKEQTRELPLLILVNKGERGRVGADLEAENFLDKPFSPRDFIAAVRSILSRRLLPVSGERLNAGSLSLNTTTHRVSSDGAPIHLKPAEFRLLAFFMAHPERVFSRTQLLDEVWGDQVFIDERAVDVQIRRLRAALAPYGHGECVETVRGTGYRFCGNTGPAQNTCTQERVLRPVLLVPQTASHSTTLVPLMASYPGSSANVANQSGAAR